MTTAPAGANLPPPRPARSSVHVKALRPFIDQRQHVRRGDILLTSALRARQYERAGIAVSVEINGDARAGCPVWFPDWRHQRCVIVASGPSAAGADLEAARGKARVLAINESWRLVPWADALYGADGNWWTKNNGVPAFTGLKVTQDGNAAARFRDLMKVRMSEVHTIVTSDPGVIGYGGNSGFQALNLAIQFGTTDIALVGFDMQVRQGVHWHGKHAHGLNNPGASTIAHWRMRFDAVAPALAGRGVRVVNCSAQSALVAYPKMTLTEALAC